MVFESLSGRLQEALKRMRGQARVTEKDVKEMMREVRLALLEADVSFKVVKDFVAGVSEKAVGQDVLESLTPGQQVVKVVHGELVKLMGEQGSGLQFSSKPPTVIMMVGLQGSGKTITSGKLANVLRKQGKKPLLVACDVYRPAAIKQLQVVGEQLGIPVFSKEGMMDVVKIVKLSLEYASSMQHDVVIIDTAGRLHINEELMEELKGIKNTVDLSETLLVVDSMTGQDAVNVAEKFNEDLAITGVILTKLDGDTRGGAALSVKAVTGKPIKFMGVGEKLSDLEAFLPDRIASRILGMGDVLTLIEKAEAVFDEKKAMELEKKLREHQFTLEDFLDQIQQVKKMGPISQILGMIPGVDAKMLQSNEASDKNMSQVEAIIKSMTKKERGDPSIINASRRQRIAAGSGTTVQEINKLLKSFEEMKKMFKMVSGSNKNKNMSNFKNLLRR